MAQTEPAVGAPLERHVRPRAWAWKDEPSGQEVYSGWEMPRPTDGSEPLYDQAAIDAAVAAERERCAKLCEDAKPRGGRMWTDEQAACFDCLTHVAAAVRA